MPYELQRSGDQWCIVKQGTNERVPGSCHADRGMTVKMMRALYANESAAMSQAQNGPQMTMKGK